MPKPFEIMNAPGEWDRPVEARTALEPERFTVQASGDEPETHDVMLDQDGDFVCLDCEANGSTTGYLVDADGAQQWHDDITADNGADEEAAEQDERPR